ncbi:MAG: hypothetical protein IKN63_00360 [Bacilli bacterium]|nr:hypothetical protein [Bacilli bacterium]
MDNFMIQLEESVFGENKYYVEIIKSFIEGYPKDTTRVIIDNDKVELKVSDIIGSKLITFKKNSAGRLKINIDRVVNLIRYQDTIIYDDYGVMMERSSCMATLNPSVNEKVNSDDLALELDNLGENLSGQANLIYENINLKKVIRPENFALDGKYIHQRIVYDNGKEIKNLIEGTFKVLSSKSITSLDFPKEDDVKIVRNENFILEDTYEYPNNRSL